MIATLNFPSLLKFPFGGARKELERVIKKMSPLAGANMATPLGVTQSVPASLLLDQVTGAAAAYSLRKLRNAYSGSAVRVRRSSDNAEQDIGFSGNNFDTSAFSSFVGAGSGFVKTFYDQSGNARDAVQATAEFQSQIVLAQINSKAIVRFDGSNDNLKTAPFSVALAQPNTQIIVCKMTMPHDSPAAVLTDGLSSGHINLFDHESGGGNDFVKIYAGGSASVGYGDTKPWSDFRQHVAILNGASSALWKNGSAQVLSPTPDGTNPGSNDLDGLTIGSRYLNSLYWTGDVAELIFYNAGLSTQQRQSVESNQNTYYALY